MEWDALEAMLRMEFEALQYCAFFGTMAFFGLLELVAGVRPTGADRRSRWPANWGLTLVNVLLTGAIPVSVVAVGDFARSENWGVLTQSGVPPLFALVAGFILRSSISYGVHFAMHNVPALWRVHRVHHTDTHLDISTAVRFHPLEFAISLPIVYGMTLLLGIPPLALMLYEVFDAAMAAFTHANVRLPARLDRALQYVLVTPAMHRIHHSEWRPQTDSNYGATLSLWDRLFGTFRIVAPETLNDLRIGLAEWQDVRTNSMKWLLALPFAAEVGGRDPGARQEAPRAASRSRRSA